MPRKKAAMKWRKINGGYESVPLGYRVEKVKGGYIPCGHCDWLRERGESPWRALYKHPFKTLAEAKARCEE